MQRHKFNTRNVI